MPLGPLIDPIDDELVPFVPLIDPFDDEYDTAGLADFFGPLGDGLSFD